MKLPLSLVAMGAFLTFPAASSAAPAVKFNQQGGGDTGRELPPYLQCVPYAREVSGIQIYGDAYSWWDQAEGRYKRGTTPKVGAVMAFRPYRNMTLGHVAAVTRVIDSRTVLLSHSNWSPINGRRGQVENDVRAVDVSPDNDWSQVRVWYDPLQNLGRTAWPVAGFIYGDKARGGTGKKAYAPTRVAVAQPKPSPAFAAAFADLGKASAERPSKPRPTKIASRREAGPVRIAQNTLRAASSTRPDPIRDAIARYEK